MKSCPFCGGEAEVRRLKNFDGKVMMVFVICKKCGASTRSYASENGAIEAWNSRETRKMKEMDVESREFKKEDGTRVRVQLYMFFEYKDIRYRISDIRYCEPRKRTWKSLEASFRNNWEYRQLNQNERQEYEIEKYIAFVGKDMLKEMIMSAWELLKPDVDGILGGLTE